MRLKQDGKIHSTLSPGEAQREIWDIIVVGAGVAGSLAARECARLGKRVLLVDRTEFPRGKICGCCLNARTLNALAASGLSNLAEALGGIELNRLNLRTGHGREADVRLRGGRAVSRRALDAALVRGALESGCEFLSGFSATGSEIEGDARMVYLRGATKESKSEGDFEVRARIVVAADGLGGAFGVHQTGEESMVAGARLGAGMVVPKSENSFSEGYEPGAIYMACGAGGYVGGVRVEDGSLNLAAALDAKFVTGCGGLGKAAAAILRMARMPPIPGIEEMPWRGTPALTRKPARVAAERFFLLGDAAGYVEPFTGEGMAWAATGALALSQLAARAAAENWDAEEESAWSDLHARIIGRRQWLCRGVAGALRRPLVTEVAVRAMGWLPALAGRIVNAFCVESNERDWKRQDGGGGKAWVAR